VWLLQHYLTMLGSTVLIPFLVVPPMGGTPEDLAAGESVPPAITAQLMPSFLDD
jgi:hypothetical protein